MSNPSRDDHAASRDGTPGISLAGLIALVISSSIGSGVFDLTADISAAAVPGPALLAWVFAGAGFMCLATTFGKLSLEFPRLNGLVAYAKEGFGPFAGFVSGWGYWLSIWIGNVAFAVMLITALGYFYPPFAHGLTPGAVVLISVLNWAIVLLVNRGVERASAINAVVMVCKLVPIFAFIAVMAVLFDPVVFTSDFWGMLAGNFAAARATGPASVIEQMRGCLMVMMWVFVGMEGATVLGHRARLKADVSRATVLGTMALVAIYVAASVLPYGFLTRAELMDLGSPAMAHILAEAVGPWGGAFISCGLVVSIFGAWLSYTILASEAMNEMAGMDLLPRVFGELNTYGAPTACLIATGAMIQVLIVVMLLSEEAYQLAYSLCTASIVVSWSLAAAFMMRHAWPRRHDGARGSFVLALIACVFLVAALLLAGLELLLLCCIAYALGIALYVHARHEHGCQQVMTGSEKTLAALIILAALFAVILLITGHITI